MLIGVLSILMTFVFRAPVLMFGFLFSGRLLVVAPLLAAQFAAGVGPLKMKLWGRTLAIYVLFFGMLSIAITILVPGSQSRWDQAMQTIYSQWGFPSFVPQFHFPIWLITVPAIPIFLIELGFVITQKTAFLATVKPPS